MKMASDPNDLSDILTPPDTQYGDEPPSTLAAASSGPEPLARQRQRIESVQGDIDTAKANRSAAYQAIKDRLDQATQHLQDIQLGPNEAEQNHLLAAQLSRPGPSLSNNMSGYYEKQAEIEHAKRFGDLPTKEKLAMQYQMAGPQYQLAQANQQIGSGIQQMRGEGMLANPYLQRETRQATTAERFGLQAVDPNNPAAGYTEIPGWARNAADVAARIAFAKTAKLIKTVDGNGNVTYKFMTPPAPAQQAPGATAPGQTPAPVDATSRLHAAAAQSAATNAAAAAPVTPQQKGPITAALFPVYTGQLGGGKSSSVLGQPDMPQAYADTANDAFSPQNFNDLYRMGGSGGGVDEKVVGANEAAHVIYKKAADGAKEQNYLYGKMLDIIDSGKLNTGTWQTNLTALKQSVRGFVGDNTLDPDQKDAVNKIMGDKISNELDFDKYAIAAGTIGLTSKFGNRVLQSEFAANLKSQPNRQMSLLAMKLLMSAQMDRNIETINKEKIHALYAAHSGNPIMFDTFYDQHFDPYGQTPLAQHVQQREAFKQQATATVQQAASLTPEQRAARMAELQAKAKAAGNPPIGPPIQHSNVNPELDTVAGMQ